MSEWKDRLAMPDAPDRFAVAIRAGGEDIRRFEARRRMFRRCAGIAAALALLLGAAAFAALRGMRPKPDDVHAGPDPSVHMTPDPSPEPTAEPRVDFTDGRLLYGGPGYQIADDLARGLPETPRIEHAYYEREPDALDGDTVAGWLWGSDCAKETYDFGAVYVHEAKKNVKSDFKAKGYVFDDDGCFQFSPDDPSNLYVGAFESRAAALEWAENWLREHGVPDEYFAHPAHPGEYGFEGERVKTVYPFRWDAQVEGVAVRGAGLSGEICTFGPNFFLLDLGRYLPVEAVDGAAGASMPAYLTAAQAVDALNWAAAREFDRIREVDPAMADSYYGSFEDTIEDIRPVFANDLFYSDTMYRLSWEITVRSAERGSTREFIVDAKTGRVWNMHDGAEDTVYTR
ncbi:MAG: hypothetical protein IKO07_10680 [Clostridia bacterium]|nr:hypothetical protein [Clostridia bacterium]